MKRIRIVGLMLLALFALGAVAASAASAEEGFLPLTKKGVTVLGTTAVLETHAKENITCKTTTGKGAFTTDSKGTGTFVFEGCTALGFAALSLAAKKEEEKSGTINANVTYAICLINSAKLEFGVAITPKETVHIEIPALGALLEVKGTVIGTILTVEGKLFVVDFAGAEGLGGVATCGTEKNSFLSKKDPEAFLEASEKVTGGLMQFEETVKLMDT